MTREQKIEAIKNAMEHWDSKLILRWAQDCMQHIMENSSDESLDEDYATVVLGLEKSFND